MPTKLIHNTNEVCFVSEFSKPLSIQFCVMKRNTMRVKNPFLVRQMPGHFKRYSACRVWYEQTRFECHDLKSKTDFRPIFLN